MGCGFGTCPAIIAFEPADCAAFTACSANKGVCYVNEPVGFAAMDPSGITPTDRHLRAGRGSLSRSFLSCSIPA